MHLGNAGYLISAVVVAAALYVVLCYNRLVRARNMLQEGWSGIDVQLRRRADLVPNLIETVRATPRTSIASSKTWRISGRKASPPIR
jgi:hypothetical protein